MSQPRREHATWVLTVPRAFSFGLAVLSLLGSSACGDASKSPGLAPSGGSGAPTALGGTGGILGTRTAGAGAGAGGAGSSGSGAGAGGTGPIWGGSGVGGAVAGQGGAAAAGAPSSTGSSSGSSGVGGTPTETNVVCEITKYGAKGDGSTLNTKAIQAAIDACATQAGGTVVVPKGSFLTGALLLKQGANLTLQDGSTLLASKNIADFPIGPSRFEGHFQDRPASLLNGVNVNHLRITGPGTLDGNGAAYWSQNLPQGRPRIAFIRDSSDVVVSGVHFKNSPSWNLHFYDCQHVTVDSSRFEIDAGADGPSTDGTDIDSCQDVTVSGCYYAVNDDCVVLKGNRYDGLNQTPASPPVSDIHVTGCTFARGKGALSVGTEATYVHDVEFDHSMVQGDFPMLRLKLRPDTAGQRYENIDVHDIQMSSTDDILAWELTHGTQIEGTAPPASIRNVTVANITGRAAAFGNIAANATTEVSTILLQDINVTVTTPTLVATGVKGLTLTDVVVNGKQWSAAGKNGQPGPQ